jgi:hypothetical protein
MSALEHADSQHYHHHIFPSDKTHRHRQDSLAERDPALVSSIPGNITGASRTQISGSKTPAPASFTLPIHQNTHALKGPCFQAHTQASAQGYYIYQGLLARLYASEITVSLFFPLVS